MPFIKQNRRYNVKQTINIIQDEKNFNYDGTCLCGIC